MFFFAWHGRKPIIEDDNRISTELSGVLTETGKFFSERNAQRSVPRNGALLACSLVGLAGPQWGMM
jgi:hypothetical protein